MVINHVEIQSSCIVKISKLYNNKKCLRLKLILCSNDKESEKKNLKVNALNIKLIFKIGF